MVANGKMLKRYLPGLLNYSQHKLTNAMSEGFNSKIQQIKSNARGFRSFKSYRIRIFFLCVKLELLPAKGSQ
jgi:transposase